MTAYDCIECLLPLIIVQYFTFITMISDAGAAANIIDKLLKRL